jgi:hypothetical protein
MKRLFLILTLFTAVAVHANPLVSYNGETYSIGPNAVLATDGSNVFKVDRTHHILLKMSQAEIDRYIENYKGHTIRIERLVPLQDALVAQGQRDWRNGKPLYDKYGNVVGRRSTNSATGETTNRDTSGNMLPPWQQW